MALMSSVKQGLRPETPVEPDGTLSKRMLATRFKITTQAATVLQILDAYLNELQNEQEVSPIAEILEFQATDTSCAVELGNSEDERESCSNSTYLQDTKLAVVDEVVGRQQDKNGSDPPFCEDSSISSNDHDF